MGIDICPKNIKKTTLCFLMIVALQHALWSACQDITSLNLSNKYTHFLSIDKQNALIRNVHFPLLNVFLFIRNSLAVIGNAKIFYLWGQHFTGGPWRRHGEEGWRSMWLSFGGMWRLDGEDVRTFRENSVGVWESLGVHIIHVWVTFIKSVLWINHFKLFCK